MNEPEEKKQSQVGAIVALVLGLIVFYTLSIGPAIVIDRSLRGSSRAIRAFYFPLIWVYDHVPACRQPLRAYARLWE